MCVSQKEGQTRDGETLRRKHTFGVLRIHTHDDLAEAAYRTLLLYKTRQGD